MEENKKNKVPNVPNLRFKEWTDSYQSKRFYNVVSITNGQVDPNDERYRLLPHIGPGNIEKETGVLLGYNLAYQDNLISSKYLFDETCVVYGKINPHFAKATFPGFAGLCSADAYPLKPLQGIDSYYLLQLVLSKRFTKYTASVSKRTGMPKVNRDDLALYKFYLPSYEEQKKISEFIKKIDTRIATQNKIIEELNSLRKTIINILIKRAYANGNIITVEKCVNEYNDKTTHDEEYPVLSSTAGGIFFQNDYFKKEAASENTTGYKKVPYGYCTYRSMSDTGRFFFNIQDITDVGIVSPAYPVFSVKENSTLFLITILNNDEKVINDILKQKAGGTRFSLPYKKLCKIKIPWPEKTERNQFMYFISLLNNKIDVEKGILSKYLVHKNFLLSNLFI